MNNELSITNVECAITGSIENKNKLMLFPDIIKENISGIYKIINKVNDKYYVGSSQNIMGLHGRCYDQIRKLNLNQHSNPHLQSAWNKYGKINFVFLIIEDNISLNNLVVIIKI